MRHRNWRLIIVGFVLFALAIGFYFFMLPIASISTDPVVFTETIGSVSGVVGGVSLVIIVFGLIGKKV